ncbi:MAG: GTP-binding protein, partial [Simkaniaceae bacterium]|nr:GTP-binding protein [Simkaniaceae bacterium]
LVSQEELKAARAIIRSLNAKAKLIETTHAEVDHDEIMDTSMFNLEEAQNHPLWAQELYNFKDHVPETEEYGITSFVYRAKEPFDPSKIHRFFSLQWEGVVRAKGFFWISTRPDFVGEFSLAGSILRHQGIGNWWVAVPKENWPITPDFDEMIKTHWSKAFGDRRQEMVFIGFKGIMDEEKIREQLDACLVQDYLKAPIKYQKLLDPFPTWLNQAPEPITSS